MMRVTKKLYALLIAGMMVVSLAGCQSTGNSSNSGNAQSCLLYTSIGRSK